jgi:hypothetical protein
LVELAVEELAEAIADRQHAHNRAHADDDAEHRQQGAHLVRAQRRECDADGFEEIHPTPHCRLQIADCRL